MSKKLQKSLQDYLSKIKKSSSNIQLSTTSVSSPKNWIPRRCKHPRTLSFAINPAQNHVHQGTSEDNNDVAATLADVDRFLFENFKSLYIEDDDEIRSKDHEDDHQVKISTAPGASLDSSRFFDLPLDICGSNRFFVSTGFSSSLIEEARSSAGTNATMSVSEDMGSGSTSSASINNIIATNESDRNGGFWGGDVTVKSLSDNQNECIAVLTYSPNAYDDFRRSMQEMVEARLKHHSEIDWDFMEELVFCYLKLNDKKSHKFILRAFVDLIMELRHNNMRIPAKSRQCKVNSLVDLSRSRRTRHSVKL